MENKAHALMAGLFTIVLLAAAILGVMWFNSDRVVRVPYDIATKLSVPGLNAQADVRYRGLDVGKVDSIKFDPSTPGQVLIRLKVNPDTPMTHSTYGTLGYQGVTGIAYVQLDDDGTQPTRLVSSLNKVARIELRPSLFDNLQSKGAAILASAETTVAKLNNFLDPENQKTMVAAFSDVSKTANEFQTIPHQMQPTLDKLPAMTDQLNKALASIDVLSKSVAALSQNLQAPNGTIAQLNGVINHVGTVAENAGSAVDNVQFETLPKISGAVSEVRTTMRGVNQAVDNFNQQPQSLIFGTKGLPPGPGEAGFAAPAATSTPAK
ncbi:MlaD family protein [Glaciimonas soli]|uniref:MCE family protein n=1 Tax=Glaciimonas soli TaxID=2590999 RepID=A0A843YNN0_9BURK|nr:MlaD family protein [Glaciimonas soli]MQR00580.1 MCE family protein [Glaciimonas soli]